MARSTHGYLPGRYARLALLTAATLLASSCTDGSDLQGPDTSGLLRVSPELTFEGLGLAEATDEALDAAWDERDRWEVVVTANPSGRAAADTVIDVSAAGEADTLEVVIETRPGDQSYDFRFTALDAAGDPLFTALMEGVLLADGDLFSVAGTLLYVGPGADAASLLLSPRSILLLPGLSTGLVATVVDEEGNVIEGVPLGWESDDPGIADVQPCDGCEAEDVLVPGPREEVDLDARVEAGTSFTVGVTLSGFDPTDVLRVTPDFDGPFVAWSAHGDPARSLYQFNVTKDEDGETTTIFAAGGPFTTPEAARDAFVEKFPNGVELTGASSYTFWIGDTPVTDNSGGVSLLVTEMVPESPNGFVTSSVEGTTRVVVSTPGGLTAEAEVVVAGRLEILPRDVERIPGGTQQFTVPDLPDGTELVWSVNGVEGGDEVFGTITPSGFYTAPAEVPTPDQFPVCAHIAGAPATEACATVTIVPTPTAGQDLVVINDMNIFDNGAMTGGIGDPNNHIMVRNLVSFEGDRVRSGQSVIMWDRGRSSPCFSNGECADDNMSVTRSVIEDAGFTIRAIESTEGSLTSIEPDVKMIWLWNPRVVFTVDEVNALKEFASEGGRILYVGEHRGFLGAAGLETEAQLLADMGAEMENVGNTIECGYNDLPASVLREHQITAGMEGVRLACASEIIPGPNDFVLFTDSSGSHNLAGVAKIDVVPISEHQPAAAPAPTEVAPSAASGAGEELVGGR